MPALRTQLPHRPEMFECRMKKRREKKCELLVPQRLGGLLVAEIGRNSKGLEHIGAAGLRSDRAISMLRDDYAGGCGDDRDGGRNVEGVQLVPAGPAHIENVAGA